LYHAHGAFFAGIGFLDRRKPLVLTIHGYLSLETISTGRIKNDSMQFEFMSWVEKMSVKRADAIIAVGNKIREWIINELEAEPNKVFYIPNGVDTTRFVSHDLNLSEIKLIKSDFGLPVNSKIILFTKHFTPRYGIQYAVRALSLILKKDPDVILVATNEDNYLNKTRALARTYGVDSSCVFMGRLPEDDLIKLYNISDVFIHPSIDDLETFGISLIEAMSCGKPVISTAVGGPKEILENGKIQMGRDVGILIPPEDVESIAESVIYLLCHPEEAREMGRHAREYVLRNYSSDLIAEKILEVYNYVLANKGANRDAAGKGSP
jgi:glycosyltransferase involved in cell wall biosynthesis